MLWINMRILPYSKISRAVFNMSQSESQFLQLKEQFKILYRNFVLNKKNLLILNTSYNDFHWVLNRKHKFSNLLIEIRYFCFLLIPFQIISISMLFKWNQNNLKKMFAILNFQKICCYKLAKFNCLVVFENLENLDFCFVLVKTPAN